MLVPDSATPLYLQLEEILRQEILSGSRREGDKLPTEVCRLFELKHGEERYCCARRVRALNGKPAVYELDYFPPQDAEFLTKELLSGSVFRLLRQWKKLRVIREKETIIRVRYAGAEAAAALGLAKRQPVVYTRTCYLDGKDRVVLMNEQYIDLSLIHI